MPRSSPAPSSRAPAAKETTVIVIRKRRVDPAADGLLQPLLFFKGFHALQVHRVAHVLWGRSG